MRPLLLSTCLAALAAPALAETYTGQARVDAVTLSPGLATVTREVVLDVAAGTHQVIVPGLPLQLDSAGLRLSVSAGAQVGAVALARDRLPVTPDQTDPAVQAAEDEVERLEEVLRVARDDIEAIRLRVQAAEDQAAFLRGLAEAKAGEPLPVADIAALADLVGTGSLAARQQALAAEQQAEAAERALKDDEEALADARQALAALTAPAAPSAALTFDLIAAEAGPVTVTVQSQEGFATWAPVYDLRLTTGDAPTLDVDRAVVVSQNTGQDWMQVRLTLSTARPGERIAPSELYPWPRRIVSEEELEKQATTQRSMADSAEGMALEMVAPAPIVAEAPVAVANFGGAVVTYDYPGRVDIRDGVEDLRLNLDRITLAAEVWAEAVPAQDSTAYRMAEFTNSTPEVLLPGTALAYVDGTLVGAAGFELLAAGATTELGFGPLDGLRLTRVVPDRAEGDVGVFTSSNQLREAAVMTIENTTGADWDVLLRDAVPYSEQDDLQFSFEATPAPVRIDPEGRRGILEWDLTVPAGQTQTVTLDYTLTWPGGYVLQ